MDKICKDCDGFEEYDKGLKHPNNCVKFLCNDGSCPKFEEIHLIIQDNINEAEKF